MLSCMEPTSVKLCEVMVVLELFQVDLSQKSPAGRTLSECLINLPCQCGVCRSHRARDAEVSDDDLPF